MSTRRPNHSAAGRRLPTTSSMFLDSSGAEIEIRRGHHASSSIMSCHSLDNIRFSNFQIDDLSLVRGSRCTHLHSHYHISINQGNQLATSLSKTQKIASNRDHLMKSKINQFSQIVILFLSITTIILIADYIEPATGSYERCDFDKYKDGCFARANLKCDEETNLCKCDANYPVLIDQGICVKRVRPNGLCEYDEQCDNSNGYFCSYSSDQKFYNCSSIKIARYQEYPHIKCRCLNSTRTAGASRVDSSRDGKHRSISNETNNSRKQNPNLLHQSNYHSSFLPRLVWIFLILTLIALIALLFLIKYQSHRIDRTFRRASEQSINSEPDVPPPYEVAIRMKL